jgi:pimeloyl-ACP methyl ester carboxylesterase
VFGVWYEIDDAISACSNTKHQIQNTLANLNLGIALPYFTTPDKCRLFYATLNIKPSRPPVVFLNGTSQTTVYWEPHANVFSEHFGVLRYDARAQGKSDIGTREVSAEMHTADLQNLLDYLNVPKAHLVGISHGAYIALRLAATAPNLVDRLVLCSIGKDSGAQVKLIIRSWLEILQRADLETMAWATLPLVFGKHFLYHNRDILDKIVAAIAARNNKDALIAHFNAIARYPSPKSFLKIIKCPTLVISGSDDPIVNRRDARQLAKDCRGRHEIFPKTGHSIPAEAPDLFHQVILDFLNQQSPSASTV